MAKILVVEDDPDISALVVHKLRGAGHTVLDASDGEAALVAVRSEQPDLVVLDWMLPRKNGLEVCEAVRADAALAGTRILMLTAKAQEADLESAFAAGADEYLQKPFSTRELVVRTQALLARA